MPCDSLIGAGKERARTRRQSVECEKGTQTRTGASRTKPRVGKRVQRYGRAWLTRRRKWSLVGHAALSADRSRQPLSRGSRLVIVGTGTRAASHVLRLLPVVMTRPASGRLASLLVHSGRRPSVATAAPFGSRGSGCRPRRRGARSSPRTTAQVRDPAGGCRKPVGSNYRIESDRARQRLHAPAATSPDANLG